MNVLQVSVILVGLLCLLIEEVKMILGNLILFWFCVEASSSDSLSVKFLCITITISFSLSSDETLWTIASTSVNVSTMVNVSLSFNIDCITCLGSS